MNWFVSVQNQTFGPYSDTQMQAFVNEGRINAASLITNTPAQGFFAASAYDIFSLWSGSGQMAVGGGYPATSLQATNRSIDTHSVIPEAPSQPAYEKPQNANHHVFVVMAEIRSDGAVQFIQRLQGFGKPQRIGDAVWLLKSDHAVEQIRNALSQCLNRQDRLFVLDSASNTPAWFNIGADLDHRIRELFDDGAE